MTQAALAGSDFTKGFVSLVETGRAGLSVRAASVFASRLGVPLAELLATAEGKADQVQIIAVRAERELAAENPKAALELVQAAKAPGPGRFRPRLLRVQGRAWLQLDEAAKALGFLEQGLREFRAQGEREMAARTLFDLAFAHARLDEPEEALLLALECERAIRSGDVVDRTLELQVRSFLAATYARRGDFPSANLQIERALTLAQDVVDPDALAMLYARLASTRQEAGDLAAALNLWQRSREELERLGRDRSVADTWHNIATTYIRMGQLRNARQALTRAETMASELGHIRLRAWISAARARIALREGRLAEATRHAREALRNDHAIRLCRAEARLVLAETLDAQRAPTERVSAAFEEALEEIKNEPPALRLRALRLFADALERRGDIRGALQRSRQAIDLVRPIDVSARREIRL